MKNEYRKWDICYTNVGCLSSFKICHKSDLVEDFLDDFESDHLKRLITSRGANKAFQQEASNDVPSTCEGIEEKLLQLTARWSALSADKNTYHPGVLPIVNSHSDFREDLKAVKANLVAFLYSLDEDYVSIFICSIDLPFPTRGSTAIFRLFWCFCINVSRTSNQVTITSREGGNKT